MEQKNDSDKIIKNVANISFEKSLYNAIFEYINKNSEQEPSVKRFFARQYVDMWFENEKRNGISPSLNQQNYEMHYEIVHTLFPGLFMKKSPNHEKRKRFSLSEDEWRIFDIITDNAKMNWFFEDYTGPDAKRKTLASEDVACLLAGMLKQNFRHLSGFEILYAYDFFIKAGVMEDYYRKQVIEYFSERGKEEYQND